MTKKPVNWLLVSVLVSVFATPVFAQEEGGGGGLPSSLFDASDFGARGDQAKPMDAIKKFFAQANVTVGSDQEKAMRLSKLLPVTEQVKVYVNFEVFNLLNHVSDTGVFTEEYNTGASNSLTLVPTPRVGEGNASQGFPDGTNARRAQISARVVF